MTLKNQKYFFVDLDGTFVRNDLFQELIVRKALNSPAAVIKMYYKHGLIGLKHFVFNNYRFKTEQIIINSDVLRLIQLKKALGYYVVLATASPQIYADYISETWKIFDKAFGSNKRCNLKGQNKLNLINSITNNNSFEYFGDSSADLVIFKQCAKFYKVTNNKLYEFTNKLS